MPIARPSPAARARSARPAPGTARRAAPPPLYTPAERARRDATRWTLVQGLLAPLQFLVFAASLALVLRTLATGDGATAAAWSVIVKTAVLYTIMVTGAIWEKVVFGRWLFARAFFWEDVVSMGVIALHTAYVWMYLTGTGSTGAQLGVALAAYAAYLVNAAQFVRKLRAARLGAPGRTVSGAAESDAAASAVPA